MNCPLILYPSTLPNSLMTFSSFIVASLGFSMLPTDSDIFSSTFPIWVPFIPFISLIAVARSSKIILNKSLRVGILVLFLILEEMLLSFSLLSMMLAVGFSYTAFILLRYVSSIPTLMKVFIMNECWIFLFFLFCLLISVLLVSYPGNHCQSKCLEVLFLCFPQRILCFRSFI
uniref:Uncharacterized protein n=2 Tax=Sus scrofa TaxID=9823 RepID=A0A8D1UPH2_PIG